MADHELEHRREQFERLAAPLFEEIAQRGGVAVTDPLVTSAPEATTLLLDAGLLRLDNERYAAVDPNTVQAQVIAPLSSQGARLISESSAWSQIYSTLGQTYRRSPSTQIGQVTELHGDEIDHFLASVVPSAQSELLTAQPQTGHSNTQQRIASDRDVAALKRGVTMRTIYQHAARRNRATRAYVAEVTSQGAEVRTLDEFFNRLIVVDREVALIPSGDNLSVALVIRDRGLIAYLVDMFERSWERGRPFTSRDTSVIQSIAEEQRAMTIRLLIEGHSDATCAKRLGVSPRTYAAYVADLKREYDAETRFQLGYLLGQDAAHQDHGA
ncbi:LuxR family transcriptional regulator [Nocardioides sp. Bht2]|uniref:LuxR family transcriptional regulator n=1 Tax=Nocardioides sp. Bht2 TaxID=3392297 RepID=UPI0039B5B276